MGTAKESELSYREKYEGIRRENKTMAVGVELHNQAYEKLLKNAQMLQEQNARLQADLQASQMSAARLGQEINTASQKANEEVFRLRKILKENGIEVE